MALTFILAAPVHAQNDAESTFPDTDTPEALHQRIDQLEAKVDSLRRELRRMRKAMRSMARQRHKEGLIAQKVAVPASTPDEQPAEKEHAGLGAAKDAAKPVHGKAPPDPNVSDAPNDTDAPNNRRNDKPSSSRQGAGAGSAPAEAVPQAAAPSYRMMNQGEAHASYIEVLAWLDKDELGTFKVRMHDWLQRYGNSPHAPDALYWLAETHYIDQEWPQSRRYYTKLIEQFPRDEKVEEAKLKLAYVYQKERKFEKARELLAELTHSQDPFIRDSANRRLQRMEREKT